MISDTEEENNTVIHNENNVINNNDNNNIYNINEILDNNNSQNVNILQNNDDIDQNNNIEYNHKITFTTLCILILNTLAIIHSHLYSSEIYKFILYLWTIKYRHQYYRILTNHYYHISFLDYLTYIIFIFIYLKRLEKEIGSLLLFIICFYNQLLISIIFLIITSLCKFLMYSIEYDFEIQNGFSSTIISLYLTYFLLSKNKNINLEFGIFNFKQIYSVFFLLFICKILLPHSNYIGNFSGILSGYIIFILGKFYILPRYEWINNFEKSFGLNKQNNFFVKKLGYIYVEWKEDIKNNFKDFELKKNDKKNYIGNVQVEHFQNQIN
jgi:membrane associated rhomboid family serine protease